LALLQPAAPLRGGGHLAAERGNRVEQSPAMPDQGDAEILQILGPQARHHPFVDLVRAERRLVLLELRNQAAISTSLPLALRSGSINTNKPGDFTPRFGPRQRTLC
jgi:hypothetical protein